MIVQTKIVSVVAGGWSVNELDKSQIPGVIIAVNDSAVHLPRYDIALSMDRLWTEWRFPFLREKKQNAWLRRSAVQNLKDQRHPWLHIFDCDHTATVFSTEQHVLNGTHSGLCAMNLAYCMAPEQLFILGFDMQRGPNGQPYWYPPYPHAPNGATTKGKYNAWARQFDAAAIAFKEIGTRVFNVSKRSSILAFQKLDPRSQWWSQ